MVDVYRQTERGRVRTADSLPIVCRLRLREFCFKLIMVFSSQYISAPERQLASDQLPSGLRFSATGTVVGGAECSWVHPTHSSVGPALRRLHERAGLSMREDRPFIGLPLVADRWWSFSLGSIDGAHELRGPAQRGGARAS